VADIKVLSKPFRFRIVDVLADILQISKVIFLSYQKKVFFHTNVSSERHINKPEVGFLKNFKTLFSLCLVSIEKKALAL